MIILDCCAAVEIVRRTERGRAARAMILEGERVVTSTLFHAEIRSAFWKYVRAGLLDERLAADHVRQAIALVDEFVPIEVNADEAFAEAVRQDCSVYDMLYLTLVRRRAATLLSFDRRLVGCALRMGLDAVEEIALPDGQQAR